MGAMADHVPSRDNAGVSWVTGLLGFNLWVMLVGAPALHGGPRGWGPLALELAPLLALAAALGRPTPAMLRFVYPAALLAPLLLRRPLMAERTLGPAGALAVIVSLAAWFLIASPARSATRGPHRPARIAALTLGLLFVALVAVVHFHPAVRTWIDGTWPGRAAEARVLLSLLGFMVWMAVAAVALRRLSRPAVVLGASLALGSIASFGVAGCDGGGDSPAHRSLGPVDLSAKTGAAVAMVDGRPIATETLQAAVAAEGPGADPRELLQRLITYELLTPRAAELGLAQAPEVVHVRRQRAVQRLIEDRFESRTRLEDVPERHLKAAFERNERVYNHPNLMKLTHLVVLAKEDAPAEERAAARTLARELHAQVQALPPTERTHKALKALVKPLQAGTIKLRAEDLGWKARASPLAERFLIAAFALKEDGAVSPVSETEFGYHVIVRLGWKDELTNTYPDVRADVLERLHPEWRRAEFMRWAEGLREAAGTQTWPELLQLLQQRHDAAAGLAPSPTR